MLNPIGRRVAVVGSGIAGLAAAEALQAVAQVTLFEADSHFGGHAHTVDVTLAGPAGPVTHGVDTGFLVFNERTYPRLIALFARLGVETAPSDMSFSVQARGGDRTGGIEWAGNNLNSVFAQRRNLLRPRFVGMLADIVRFNKLATALAASGQADALAEPIGSFLQRHRFGAGFADWYFLPMIGCIWSCPTEQMLRFPVATMIRFCHNHGLLQISNRPQWFTVRGGSRRYVDKLVARLPGARLDCAVRRVQRLPPVAGNGAMQGSSGAAGVLVSSSAGDERFDAVVMACHSDQALALLADVSADERAVLGAIRYQRNRAVLHTDARVLPRRRLAWAAWNYVRPAAEADGAAGAQGAVCPSVCLHYLINRLQPLPWQQPVLVSLNPDPAHAPDERQVISRHAYSHPVFDEAAIAAQQRVPALQGRGNVWFCGAWTRYGFHEDGLGSGLDAAAGIRAAWAAADALPAAA